MSDSLSMHPVPTTGSIRGRGLAVAGLALSSISAFGVHRIMARLMNAYPGPSGAATGEGPPPELARALGIELATWLAPGLIALVLISLALWKKANQETWFFACCLGLALVWLPNFFPFGLYLALIFLAKWKAFFRKRRNPSRSGSAESFEH